MEDKNNPDSLRYEKQVPDYADPRAHKFFRVVYTGHPHKYATTFLNDHKDLRKTQTVTLDSYMHFQVCAYCGNRAFAMQMNMDHGNFETTGYCCICPAAFHEIEILALLDEAEKQYKYLCRELIKSLPKINKEKLKQIKLRSIADKKAEDLTMEDLSMELVRPDNLTRFKKDFW